VVVAALGALFCAQELLEGMLAAGHPSGLEGVIAHGGWTAVVFAAPVAAAIVLVVRIGGEELAPRISSWPPPLGDALRCQVTLRSGARRAVDPLAGHLGGRAPPLLLAS